MLSNIGKTNITVIYRHSTVITKVMLLHNTEWQYDHGMAVNYRGKKFCNIGPWIKGFFLVLMDLANGHPRQYFGWKYRVTKELISNSTGALNWTSLIVKNRLRTWQARTRSLGPYLELPIFFKTCKCAQ